MEVEDKRINFCPDYTEEKILKAWNKLNESTNPRVFADEVLPSMEEDVRGPRNTDFWAPYKTSSQAQTTHGKHHAELEKRSWLPTSQWQ